MYQIDPTSTDTSASSCWSFQCTRMHDYTSGDASTDRCAVCGLTVPCIRSMTAYRCAVVSGQVRGVCSVGLHDRPDCAVVCGCGVGF